MENQPSDHRKAIQELITGQDLANQLLEFVHNSHMDEEDDGSFIAEAEQLLRKILRSFTDTLLLLNTNNKHDPDHLHISTFPNTEDLDESTCKSLTTKTRRGCYKRKRTIPTLEKDSATLIDDGHAWRKYGQKMTLNAKYQRNYYRCTHKSDQGCEALKQVQRIQGDPPKYRTTYYGYHTCKNLLNPYDITGEPASPSHSNSIFLSFDSNTFPGKQGNPFSSASFALTKEEPKEGVLDHHDHMAHNQFSSTDCPLSQELTSDSFGHVTLLSSTLESDHGDVISYLMFQSIELNDAWF